MAIDQALNRITVVLVTYQSAHCIPQLSRCLAQFPHVTIVDNSSTDDTVTQFQKYLPQAKLILNERNYGFGAANNRGIEASNTEFLLLLNPDCIIDTNAAISLIHCADTNPTAVLIAPQLNNRKGEIDLSYSWTPGCWRARGPQADGDLCVGFASGACMLIRQDAMLKIKGFDEDFFLYYEDTDLCLRLAKHGELIIHPQSKVTHFSRSSSGGKGRLKAEYNRGYHHIQSKFIFELKHSEIEVSTQRRLRYSFIALIELAVRALILDGTRSARVLGRIFGALNYRRDMKSRQLRL